MAPKVTKPQGKFKTALDALGPYISAEGKVEGSGWSSAKSWSKHAGLYDEKAGALTPLGKRYRDYGNRDALTLYFLAVNLQHPEAKEDVLREIRERGLRLEDEQAAMLVGYTITKFHSAFFGTFLRDGSHIGNKKTRNLDDVVRVGAALTGLYPDTVHRAIRALARGQLAEVWMAAPPFQFLWLGEHLTEADWIISNNLNKVGQAGHADAVEQQRRREAEERAERERQIQEDAQRKMQEAVEADRKRREAYLAREAEQENAKKAALARLDNFQRGVEAAEQSSGEWSIAWLESKLAWIKQAQFCWSKGYISHPGGEGRGEEWFSETGHTYRERLRAYNLADLRRQQRGGGPRKVAPPKLKIAGRRAPVRGSNRPRLTLTIRARVEKRPGGELARGIASAQRTEPEPMTSHQQHLEKMLETIQQANREAAEREAEGLRKTWKTMMEAGMDEAEARRVLDESYGADVVASALGAASGTAPEGAPERVVASQPTEQPAEQPAKPAQVVMRMPSAPARSMSTGLRSVEGVEESTAERLKQNRAAAGRKSTSVGKRDRESIARGVAAAAAKLRMIAEAAAAKAEAKYLKFMPSSVASRDPIRVEVAEVGGTFELRVAGAADAQKWARILEDGTHTAVDLVNTARLSKKRKAVQIYRAKRGKGGKLILRSGKEGQPGYYLTVPFSYGRGTRGDDGKIQLDEVIERVKYDALGQRKATSLTDRDMSAMRSRVMTPAGEITRRGNELSRDPLEKYEGKRFWERQDEFSDDTDRYGLDGDGDPKANGRGPGRIVTQDKQNNRYVLSDFPAFSSVAPQKKRTQTSPGKFDAIQKSWVDVGGGIFEEKEVTLGKGEAAGYETVESAKLTRKLGGQVMFRQQGGGKGEFVRFRRISTRGTAPLNPVPANPNLAKHIMRDARAAMKRAIGEAIKELKAQGTRHKNGLTIAQQAELETLERARG